MKTFNLLSRPSAYDTAKALANRDDALQGSTPKEALIKLYIALKTVDNTHVSTC